MQRGDNNFIHELVHGHKWIMTFLKCPLKCKTPSQSGCCIEFTEAELHPWVVDSSIWYLMLASANQKLTESTISM